MGIECAYSYSDLFYAAYGRMPNSDELSKMATLTQTERNRYVKELARAASWQTQDKVGSDLQIYTAFAPSFK